MLNKKVEMVSTFTKDNPLIGSHQKLRLMQLFIEPSDCDRRCKLDRVIGYGCNSQSSHRIIISDISSIGS